MRRGKQNKIDRGPNEKDNWADKEQLMGVLRYLDRTGDQKVLWDPTIDAEVDAARATFDMLTKKNFKAFSVNKDGSKGKAIKKFNPRAGRIIMIPPLVGG